MAAKLALGVVAGVLAAGALFLGFTLRVATPQPPSPGAAGPRVPPGPTAPSPVSPSPTGPGEGAIAPAAVAPPSPEPAPRADREAEARAFVAREPDLQEQAERIERERVAEERFHAAVERHGLKASDADPAVRRLFRDLQLEPELLDGGGIDGLLIRSLPHGHPLAAAGFREGDVVVRVAGRRLDDPEAVALQMIALRPRETWCVRRDGRERCAEVVAGAAAPPLPDD